MDWCGERPFGHRASHHNALITHHFVRWLVKTVDKLVHNVEFIQTETIVVVVVDEGKPVAVNNLVFKL